MQIEHTECVIGSCCPLDLPVAPSCAWLGSKSLSGLSVCIEGLTHKKCKNGEIEIGAGLDSEGRAAETEGEQTEAHDMPRAASSLPPIYE